MHTSVFDTDILTTEQICDMFSVSTATVKNWIRLGKLPTQADGKTVSFKAAQALLAEIKSGKDGRLKSRRNKGSISGKMLYKDYINNESNRQAVEKILSSCQDITEDKLRIILAHFAVQLYSQSSGSDVSADNWFTKQLPATDNSVFNALVSELIGSVDIDSFDLEGIKSVFNFKIQYVPSEDTLGSIYLSLRDLGNRKQTGAYYTPAKTVNTLIRNLSDCIDLKSKTVCDISCGTGNFLIGLLADGISAKDLYGQDIDPISILITRINVFLRDNRLSLNQLHSHFICGNTLTNTFKRSFSVVLGNPPWGYDFSKEETAYLIKNYRTAKPKGTESFDLFIEKGLSMLEQDGYLAYVLPEALLSVSSHLKARELIVKSASFKFVSYLGNAFSGVQCPAVILGLKKDGKGSTKHCKVTLDNKEFTLGKDRKPDASLFSFNIDDEEYGCIQTIGSVPNARYLANNAEFALGIVTGDNKKYIKDKNAKGFEPVIKGSDVFKYRIKSADNYLRFTPESFQQVAPTEIYRAKEKLLYRFICKVPVFAYDDGQRLSLNSCNILIPKIDGMNIKYVLAVLNSSVAAFFISKKFNSVKLLRAHIEALPIPLISEAKQNEIIKKAELIMNSKQNALMLYEELDNDIMELYRLSSEQRKTVKAALNGKNFI